MYQGMKANKKFAQNIQVFSSTPELDFDEKPKKYARHKKRIIPHKPKKEFESNQYVPTQEEIVKENLKSYSPEDVVFVQASSSVYSFEDDRKEDDRDIKKNSRRLKRMYRRLKGDSFEDELILTPENVEKDALNRKLEAQQRRDRARLLRAVEESAERTLDRLNELEYGQEEYEDIEE